MEWDGPLSFRVKDFLTVRPSLDDDDKSSSYEMWKEQMVCLVESQELMGFLDGTAATSDDDINLWRKRDKLVKGWILGSIGRDALAAVVRLKTARDVWLELENLFNQLQSQSQSQSQSGSEISGQEDNESSPRQPANELSSQSGSELSGQGVEAGNILLQINKAAVRGDWETAKKLFDESRHGPLVVLNSWGETALHVAALTGKANNYFVTELLKSLQDDDDLSIGDVNGDTPLHNAVVAGNIETVRMLVSRWPHLQYVKNKYGNIPLMRAIVNCHKDIIQHLISTSREDVHNSLDDENFGVGFIHAIISSEYFDVASNLVEKYPKLATIEDEYGNAALSVLAMTKVFRGGKPLSFRQNLFYSCYCLEWTNSTNVGDIEKNTTHDPPHRWFSWHRNGGRFVGSILWKIIQVLVPEWKTIIENRRVQDEALKLCKILCQRLQCLGKEHAFDIQNTSIINAAEHGNHEIIELICETFPSSIFHQNDDNDQNIFHIAVTNRFENVLNLIYQMSDCKYSFYDWADTKNNTYLHLCGKLAPSHKLNLVAGAALQMQRELQWFKEVEKLVRPSRREWTNEDDKTPQEIFTEEHLKLKTEGEKWMKDTSTSCTIAAALIATVVFTAAFTVPGGFDSQTGIPLLWGRFPFSLFLIADTISFFTSITSLLVFLSILTSRYAEEDFLYALPKRLIIGLLTLFISITFMLIAFSAALYLVAKQRRFLLIPITITACLPVVSFGWLQFPLLLAMVKSTYFSRTFGKKSKTTLY